MGPVVVFLLGLGAGALLSRPGRAFLPWTLVAGAAAALAWIAGGYVLFALTAPDELGPPLARPIVYTLLTALLGAALAGLARRSR